MLLRGMLLGVITAILQSISYLASAWFIRRHGSALKLLISSHLIMGMASAVLLPFCFPDKLFSGNPGNCLLFGLWIITFSLGQGGFFLTQKHIESSRLASLLGLKIVVLALIWSCGYGNPLNWLQIGGIGLSVIAAFVMNWSGSVQLSFKGIVALTITLVAFSVTDITETHMVLAADSGDIVSAGIAVTMLCYVTLGIFSLPFLAKVRITRRMLLDALPFAALWLLSQISLLICFGILRPVFGNVIQSSRCIFSVLLGCLACHLGWDVMEQKASLMTWIRRAIAALLMIGGIACFSFGKIIG